jgi:hypothetical protein
MKTRMSFEAMQMPADEYDESDMGPWANKWHFTESGTATSPQDATSQDVTSEEPTTPGALTDSAAEDE